MSTGIARKYGGASGHGYLNVASLHPVDSYRLSTPGVFSPTKLLVKEGAHSHSLQYNSRCERHTSGFRGHSRRRILFRTDEANDEIRPEGRCPVCSEKVKFAEVPGKYVKNELLNFATFASTILWSR